MTKVEFMLNDHVFKGIKFAVSRMGLQFNSEQEEKYSDDIFKEYLKVQERINATEKREESESICK